METQREKLKAHLDGLPMFPLPTAVLLPYEILPLHIFEPRYRAMIADVLERGLPLAIAQLAPGWEGDYEGRPRVEPVCGAGIVVRHEKLDDGRYNILMKGVGRIHIDAELPAAHAYREIRAHLLEDVLPAGGEPALEEGAESLKRMLFALCAAKPGPASSALAQLASRAETASTLSDLVIAALLADAPRRHKALVTLEVGKRLELAQGAVAELLVAGGGKDDGLRN